MSMRNRLGLSKHVLTIGLSLVLISFSGCTDLSPIRRFADLASDAATRFPALTKDLTGSCRRQIYYQNIRENLATPERMLNLSDPNSRALDSNPAFAPCKIFAEQEPRLSEANAVLMSYLRTMADLASDERTSFDQSLGGLAGAFNEAGLFQPNEVSAVKKLAGLILKAATDGYRRNKLQEVIAENNEAIRTLTVALQRIITQKYVLQLQNERDALRNFYVSTIREVPSQSPILIIQIKKQWDQDDADVQRRINAANAYGQIMTNIANAHQSLFEGRNQLSNRQVLNKALSYGITIHNLAEDFRKAF